MIRIMIVTKMMTRNENSDQNGMNNDENNTGNDTDDRIVSNENYGEKYKLIIINKK